MTFLQKLNEEQERAVKHTEGPLLIIAGSGSGKTRVITNKIAYLIESKGVAPENILALTFTDKAAEEMLTRVEELIDFKGDLEISTFHSFCNKVIKDNILDIKLNANFKLITDTTQLVFFLRNIDNFGFESVEYGSNPVTLVEEIKKTISRLKDELVTPDDLEDYIKKAEAENSGDPELPGMKDILRAYRAYEEYKEKNNMLDFGDLLIKVYELLKNKPKIREYYQNRYKYVLVDEFQDTNFVQLQIVKMIAERHKNITIVGDDDQSIYRFRGAYLTNLQEFKRLFPDYEEVFLEQNYRSTKNILQVANRLIANNPDRMEKNLFSEIDGTDKVMVGVCANEDAQATFIVSKIKGLLQRHNYEDIAVLCRRKADSKPIIRALQAQRIPCEFIGDSSFFRQPVIKDVISYLKVIDNPTISNVELARIMHMEAYAIKRTDISKITNYASKNKISVYEALENFKSLDVDKEKIEFFRAHLKEMEKKKNKMPLLDLVYEVLFSLPFYRHETAMENEENIRYLNLFYKLASEYDDQFQNDNLSDFLDYLDNASSFEILESDVEIVKGAVNIMTIHQSKGKEFPVVFIPDLTERRFPTTQRSDKFKIPEALLKGVRPDRDEKELHIEEERRLFYVAITRAMRNLFITTVTRYGSNRRDSKPSRFLEEINFDGSDDIELVHFDIPLLEVKEEKIEDAIKQSLKKEVVSSLYRENYKKAIEKILILAKINHRDKAVKKELLERIGEPDVREIFEQIDNGKQNVEREINGPIRFSVSQFNTYKRCPKVYRYRYIYGIPTKPKPYFDFGGSIHKVVENLTRMMNDGQEVNIDIAVKLLDKYWRREGYSSKAQEQQEYEQAKEILKVFLEENAKIKRKTVGIEKKFTINLGGNEIYGVIDRIDEDRDDLIVLDYKTSKRASSKNEIRKDLQLLTYTLGAEQLFGKRPKQVGLWFLRLNKIIVVDVVDEDVEKVKEEALSLIENILKENFEPKPGWECKNCDYGMLCDDKV